MKKFLLILTVLIFATSTIEAQKNNRQKIKLLKTSFITDAIDLTPEEAEKFWPIYNLYSDKIQKLRKSLDIEKHRTIRSSGGIENISESDAKKIIAQMLSFEEQIGTNKITLIKELSKIISAKKIVSLQKAERDFNRQILQEFNRRKRGFGN